MPRHARPTPPAAAIRWPRADPAALAAFDPRSKHCVMNCGPATDDPRTAAERKLLCDECRPRTKTCTTHETCRPGAVRDKVSDGVFSMTVKCRECGAVVRWDWD